MLAALSSFCLVWKFPGRSEVLTLGNLQEGSYYFSPTHSTHTSPPEKGFDDFKHFRFLKYTDWFVRWSLTKEIQILSKTVGFLEAAAIRLKQQWSTVFHCFSLQEKLENCHCMCTSTWIHQFANRSTNLLTVLKAIECIRTIAVIQTERQILCFPIP